MLSMHWRAWPCGAHDRCMHCFVHVMSLYSSSLIGWQTWTLSFIGRTRCCLLFGSKHITPLQTKQQAQDRLLLPPDYISLSLFQWTCNSTLKSYMHTCFVYKGCPIRESGPFWTAYILSEEELPTFYNHPPRLQWGGDSFSNDWVFRVSLQRFYSWKSLLMESWRLKNWVKVHRREQRDVIRSKTTSSSSREEQQLAEQIT